jgi:hypothetical protein
VLVVISWSDVFLLKLLLDIAPDLSHFEVRIHLNHLQFLLFVGVEIVSGKTHSIQDGKYYQPDVILLDFFADSIDQVSLCSSFS